MWSGLSILKQEFLLCHFGLGCTYMTHEISLSLRKSHKINNKSAWHITTFFQECDYHSKCVYFLRRWKRREREGGGRKGRRGMRMKEKERE